MKSSKEISFEQYLIQARNDFVRVAAKYSVGEHLELRTAIDDILIAYDQAVNKVKELSPENRRCRNCKHYKPDSQYESVGYCENGKVMGDKILFNHCDEFFVSEGFGCHFFETIMNIQNKDVLPE